MALFIEKLIFQNRSPFENLVIDLEENEIGVISGINGRGKTTILSHIADAFHELAKLGHPNSYEGKATQFYRVASSADNFDSSKPSVFYMRVRLDGEPLDYASVNGPVDESLYEKILLEGKIPFATISAILSEQSFIKKWSTTDSKIAKKLFDTNLATYFPSYRYETPAYLNGAYIEGLSFRTKGIYTLNLPNPIEVVTGLAQLANWIMDIVLDGHYHASNVKFLKETVDWILTLVMTNRRLPNNVRFGIGARGNAFHRIQITDTVLNTMVCPSIFSLSAGESAALTLFGEIVRQADNLDNNTYLNNTSGVVLIDEIDKHLHIFLQKEIIPALIKRFPNIQFIITSHSPFFNMGLAEIVNERTKIIDLDNSGITTDATTNDLYREVYQMMLGENVRYQDLYVQLKEANEKNALPLIVTEGKTDIQHLKAALAKLKLELDVDFFEPDGSWGDAKLKVLLEQLSKVQRDQVVIGIFDRDVKSVIDEIEADGLTFKSFGNKVYAFCLPTPQNRENYKNISIEFYYSDE